MSLILLFRIETEYDRPCIQHPDRRAQMEDSTDPTVTALKMLFSRHDVDGSGEIEVEEVKHIFAENELLFDPDELEIIFHKFDGDKR
jgi:Ca2+-binding EF-hand superfamily protein